MNKFDDPIAFELFKSAIFAIADEMALTIFRTSYSAVMQANMDYSTALANAEGKKTRLRGVVPAACPGRTSKA